MSDKGKWPFDASGAQGSKDEAHRDIEREHQRLAAEISHRQHLRNDRLLVGGRAHNKKPGLS